MSETRDLRLLLHAFVDGELDAAGALEMEQALAADPVLAAEYERLLALRGVLRSLPPMNMPATSRTRIMAQIAQESRVSPAPAAFVSRRRFGRAALAAAAASVAGVAYLSVHRAPDETVARDLVHAHMRAQISGNPFDVASSDRHVVKPWLAAKIPAATFAPDLAASGFPLAGARIDIAGTAPAPTLVYRRRQHLVSVTQLPRGYAPLAPRAAVLDGYPILRWSDGDRDYLAVSDIAAAELEAFVALFREAAAAETPAARK